jgi:hypothetical protein
MKMNKPSAEQVKKLKQVLAKLDVGVLSDIQRYVNGLMQVANRKEK